MPRGRYWVRTNSPPRTPWGTCSLCPESAPWWWGAVPPLRWTTMCALPGSSLPLTPNTCAGWKHGPSIMQQRVLPIRSPRDVHGSRCRHHADTAQPDGQGAAPWQACCMQRIVSMPQLTSEGQQKVTELAQRYGVSTEAVLTLLQALVHGHGTMAQFDHRELGGRGQWMPGGMVMVGDMFNQALKARVDGLCADLAS